MRKYGLRALIMLAGVLVVSCQWLVFSCFAQEQLTITTYYPSPYGSYNDLMVADRQVVGDYNDDGQIDNNDITAIADTAGVALPQSLAVAGNIIVGGKVNIRPDASGIADRHLPLNIKGQLAGGIPAGHSRPLNNMLIGFANDNGDIKWHIALRNPDPDYADNPDMMGDLDFNETGVGGNRLYLKRGGGLVL